MNCTRNQPNKKPYCGDRCGDRCCYMKKHAVYCDRHYFFYSLLSTTNLIVTVYTCATSHNCSPPAAGFPYFLSKLRSLLIRNRYPRIIGL
ncbi:Uncharacterised protein [Chlamydia trachomatis]|nr:Uncharacterised protein [Chlamydia trachomatis]